MVTNLFLWVGNKGALSVKEENLLEHCHRLHICACTNANLAKVIWPNHKIVIALVKKNPLSTLLCLLLSSPLGEFHSWPFFWTPAGDALKITHLFK
jgi:hypothetical protein